MSDCNIVLVTRPQRGLRRPELLQIADRVAAFDPGIRTHIVSRNRIVQLRLMPLWWRPTMSVSFRWMRAGRRLLPGCVLQGTPMNKAQELARLRQAGVPVPDWTVVSPDTSLDPEEWGPYVVEKPTRGHRGGFVRIRRTRRVRYRPPDTFAKDHPGRKSPLIAQRFVYTGEWPTSYRVSTLFGHVLASYRQTTKGRGVSLPARWDVRGGISIVSNTRDMTLDLDAEEDVKALASRTHDTAFPDVPALSIDIVRDAETGSLYVLETHPHGSWMFSTDAFRAMEMSNNLDVKAHFDVPGTAARVLAHEARRRASVRAPFQTAFPDGN